jgi:hypothetical protein
MITYFVIVVIRVKISQIYANFLTQKITKW